MSTARRTHSFEDWIHLAVFIGSLWFCLWRCGLLHGVGLAE